MANRASGELDITIDGKAYTLRPSYAAICEFEDGGCSVFEAIQAAGERKSVPLRRMAMAFHSCIKAAWKPAMGRLPTIDDIGQGIRADGVTEHIGSYVSLLSNMMTGERALKDAQAGN